jgi:hypothetical protein
LRRIAMDLWRGMVRTHAPHTPCGMGRAYLGKDEGDQ